MQPLTLDYTNVLADAVGTRDGVSPAELEALVEPSAAALQAVQARRTRDLRWLDLPHQSEMHARVRAYADQVHGRFETVVVLGIGGSALGNRALHSAVHGPFPDLGRPEERPRLMVLDNVDPDLVGPVLEGLDLETTLFNVISKSGSTAETMSQFLVFRRALIERLGEEAHTEHVVVTTDAEAGVLRPIVNEVGYDSFEVPEGVGGRFSVLSPVGLVSSALVGIDIEALVAGAAAMDARCRAAPLFENPALLYAGLQWLMQAKKDKNIAVTFSYSQRLADLADWYAQLLAESIGKRKGRGGLDLFTGPTPVRAVGVTDQHSQVQLFVEGPRDKWFTLLAVDQSDHEVRIPEDYSDREALAYLGGRRLVELFHAEREGTRIALTEAGRPNLSVHFPRVDESSIGQYLYLMELAVAVMGEHYGVDAFDQPGVEAGKVAAYALMGRAGYDVRRDEIEAARPETPRVV